MLKLSFYTLLAYMVFAVIGAPTAGDTQVVGGFISQAGCEGDSFYFSDPVVVGPGPQFPVTAVPTINGLCPGPDGNLVSTSLNIDNCLTNSNANLVWQTNGGFGQSCGQCTLSVPNLCCSCGLANGGSASGVCVNLDEGVAAVNGILNCDDLP